MRVDLVLKRFITLCIALQAVASFADEDDSMTHTAKVAQSIQVKLKPMVQVPLSDNYNRNVGANNNISQNQIQLNPVIPIVINQSDSIILNPMFTTNINNQNNNVTNQEAPFQLATYFARTTANWVYGAGPFIQLPAFNANGGSKQTGVGASYGLIYQPKHWAIGATAYNIWGVGNNLAGGTATQFSATSLISYTTNNAWSYSLSSQVISNFNAGMTASTNQLTLSGGKTVKLGGRHWQIQAGPTYMVTKSPGSAQGWGGYFSLTAAFAE
jgi:hypothetical protein